MVDVNELRSEPLFSPVDETRPLRVAMLYPWPGSIENGEFEIIRRLQFYFQLREAEFDLVANDGRLLDKNANPIGTKLAVFEDYDFVLSCHYSSHKIIDSFHYHALWNPTEFLLHKFNNPVGLTQALVNIFSNDDFIVSTSKSVIERLAPYAPAFGNQLDSILPKFFPSSPDYGFKTSITSDFKIFYCGINWDAHNQDASKERWNRFSEMFRALDNAEIMDFYGPTYVNGREPWAGFSSYRGQLPFDGISLIHAINQSGVGLALASDAHRECGGMLSSRAYEILAAGSLLISDRNSFLEYWFGDSILFIDFDPRNPIGIARQVMHHAQWIKENLDEASKKAKRAQEIWRRQFAFEITIPQLVEQHRERLQKFERRKCAKIQAECIDVLLVLDGDFDLPMLDGLITTFNNQSYANKRIIILCDPVHKEACRVSVEYAGLQECECLLVTVDTVQNTPKGPEKVPLGRLIDLGLRHCTGAYISFLTPGVTWSKHHLSMLKRVLEDNADFELAYGGTMKVAPEIVHPVLTDEILHHSEITKIGDYAYRGNLLICRSYLEKVPVWLLAATDRVSELTFLISAILGNTSVFCRNVTTYIAAGKDNVSYTVTEEMEWRNQSVLREVCRVLGVRSQDYLAFFRENGNVIVQETRYERSSEISAGMVHESVIAALKNIISSNRLLRAVYSCYKRFC